MRTVYHSDGPKARRARATVVATWLLMLGVMLGSLTVTLFGAGTWKIFAAVCAGAVFYSGLAVVNLIVQISWDRADARAAAATFVRETEGSHERN